MQLLIKIIHCILDAIRTKNLNIYRQLYLKYLVIVSFHPPKILSKRIQPVALSENRRPLQTLNGHIQNCPKFLQYF